MTPEVNKLRSLYKQLDQQQAAGEDVVADLKKEINNLELAYLKEQVLPQVAQFMASKVRGLRCEIDSSFQFDGDNSINYSFCTSGSMLFVKDKIEVNSAIELSDINAPRPAFAPQSIKGSTNEQIPPQLTIRIVDYSEKAVAVYGDTRMYAEAFKEKGGYFNPRLREGAGWIFSKRREKEIRELLKNELNSSTVCLLPSTDLKSQQEVAKTLGVTISDKKSLGLKCTLEGFRKYLFTKKNKNGRNFSLSSINVYCTATRSNYMRSKVLKYHHTGYIYNISDPSVISLSLIHI